MTVRVGASLHVTSADTPAILAAWERAQKAGISGVQHDHIELEDGTKTYWLVDSSTVFGEHHLVKVEQRDNGQIRTWCECLGNWRPNYCKHQAWALHAMGLLPERDA